MIAINNTWTTLRGTGLSQFRALIRLDLSYNKIKNVNGEAFDQLSQMNYLNLSGNMIESFDQKSFKIYANQLQELDLSHNKLRQLGGELNELPNLRELHLQHNQLVSISDDAFLKLKNLTYLNLQHNILTSIGSFLVYLKGLKTLDLSDNYLMSLSANDVNGLISIVNFNISHNELKSVETSCFGEAKQLQIADFSFNNIDMTIEENMFINNHELSYLNFYHNKIRGVHVNALKNPNLRYLNLEKNHFNNNKLEKPKTVPVLSQPVNVIDTKNNPKADIKEPSPVINTTEPQPTISNQELVAKLKTEIQDIRMELGDLTSTVANLTLTLKNYNKQIDHILEHP